MLPSFPELLQNAHVLAGPHPPLSQTQTISLSMSPLASPFSLPYFSFSLLAPVSPIKSTNPQVIKYWAFSVGMYHLEASYMNDTMELYSGVL